MSSERRCVISDHSLVQGPSPPRDVYSSGREKGYGTMFSPETQGISTGTVLMISNLSGTVSRTDIIVRQSNLTE